MTDFPQFYVVVFSRAEASEIRIEATMTALSERHAASLASHFAGDGQGAIAFSQSGDPSVGGGKNVKVLARLGDVLPHGPIFWALERTPGYASVHANPLARTGPVTNTLRIALSRVMLFAARQGQILRQGSSLSRAIASLVAVALAVSGGSLVALAKGAKREARLMEMARPVCSRSDIENKQLRRLVRHNLHDGLSKKHVFYVVASLCQANSREG
jgi:hypothetical protein